MNRYILIRRLRGPAFIVLVGVNAALAQAHILAWGKSWPFYLILAGVFALAERAALATDHDSPAPYPGAPYGAAPGPAVGQAPAPPGSAIVPAQPQEFGKGPEGGQS